MSFAADTAVCPVGPGRYTAELHERWSSLVGIHGGYTAAIVVNAITAAVDDPMRTLRSFATQFAAVPHPGPVDIEVSVERAGRSMTTTSARLLQERQVLQVAHAASSPARPGISYDDLVRPATPIQDTCRDSRPPARSFISRTPTYGWTRTSSSLVTEKRREWLRGSDPSTER